MQIELPKERNLFFSSQFDQKTIMDLSKSIIEINDNDTLLENTYSANGISINRKPIKIFIDSYGGYVYQCMGLIGIVEKSKTPIHTIVTGAAMSCGFMLLIAGHKRFAYEHATMMYHQVSHGVDGKIQDIADSMVEVERLQTFLENFTLRRTNINKEKLIKNRRNKHDWYFNSKDALKFGVVDELI